MLAATSGTSIASVSESLVSSLVSDDGVVIVVCCDMLVTVDC